MRFLILVFSLFLAIISCKMEPKTLTVKPKKFDKKEYQSQLKSEDNSPKNKLDSLEIQDSKPTNQNFEENSDTIRLTISKGLAKTDAVKKERQKIIFEFDSNTANRMRLKVIPTDSSANIRVSQIMDAENNSDGPFGREVEYRIQKKGKQKVVVSESLMQGEPWAGEFTFEVRLLW